MVVQSGHLVLTAWDQGRSRKGLGMKTYVFSDEHNCDHAYVRLADHDAALRRAKAEGVRGLIGHEQLAIQILNALERGGYLVSGPDGEEIGMTILDEADKFLDARAAQIEEGA